MAKLRLLLAEDHKEMCDAIVSLLGNEFEIVGTMTDGEALVKAEPRLKPDVCVIDISMPILNGIEAALLLRKNGSTAKIVFLTGYRESAFLESALETGALGYVLKPRMAMDLLPAIKGAMAGELFISPLETPAPSGRDPSKRPKSRSAKKTRH